MVGEATRVRHPPRGEVATRGEPVEARRPVGEGPLRRDPQGRRHDPVPARRRVQGEADLPGQGGPLTGAHVHLPGEGELAPFVVGQELDRPVAPAPRLRPSLGVCPQEPFGRGEVVGLGHGGPPRALGVPAHLHDEGEVHCGHRPQPHATVLEHRHDAGEVAVRNLVGGVLVHPGQSARSVTGPAND